jgi:sugar phosphate permease
MTLSAMVGTAGNLVATLPLTIMLATVGWATTFVATGLGTAGLGAVVATTLKVPTEPAHAGGPPTLRQVVSGVTAVWRVPATRLGFWVHFATMVGPATLGLLWGYPYLVRAQGLSPVAADEVLGALVVGGLIANPILGALTTRRRGLRMPIVVGYLAVAALLWPPLLAGGRPLSLGALVVIFGLLALGGPISTVGFMLARDYNPLHRVGTATGVVNVGGFFATTVATLAMGVLVGIVGYRAGLLAVVAVAAFGTCRMVVWWRRARAEVMAAQARGETMPVSVRRRRWDIAEPVGGGIRQDMDPWSARPAPIDRLSHPVSSSSTSPQG